ncbi:MAG TPA: rhomboid family intramembrane serine protease [Burkholderiales bacterium]|nr:rhomboid family intramembrane serine protease [Burkholderiales bacterium]
MFYALPPATRWLLLANVAFFLVESLSGTSGLVSYLALWPLGTAGAVPFEPWQIVTYSFLHASFWHLFVNMFALYMFGGELERLWGQRRYVQLYFASVVAAALSQLVFASVAGAPPYPTVGASGGIFGLLLAYAMYFPHRTIVLLIPPIPMPAWLFVTLYGLLELYLGVTGTQEGVAHVAHLGGMLGAWILILYWRGRLPFGTRRRR